MAVVPILIAPNDKLVKKCSKVTKFDKKTQQIADDLMDTLLNAKNPEGAGLAAPQIGILKRMCIVRNFFQDPVDPEKVLSQEILLINPKIISSSDEIELDWEGCLSIPDVYGKVKRSRKVKIRAFGIDGEEFRINATGYLARVIQHEIDHLNGILFTTKVVGETLTEKELEELEEKEEAFVG